MTLKYAKKSYSKRQINKLLNPLVSEWLSNFKKLTPPQKYAIPIINNKENTLIASSTGSGKTISAFLNVINDLINLKTENKLEDAVYCIYISPLRSLNNDIRKNLLIPLNNIQEKAQLKNEDLSEIRVGIRTGDTPQNERAKMLRSPPHILITTPETLAIILCAPKFRECLRKVKCVILDEIHEICTSKRGVHLSLSLERLQELANDKFTRIGLSATIHPLDEVAKFLVGQENGIERDCTIVDTRFVKPIEFKVTCPVPDLIHTSSSKINSKLYSSIRNNITNNHTTLIFTNTRSNTERVVHQLERLGSVNVDELAAHHGSLSREMRQEVENKLKEGNMKVVVTSTSLELGVDIGSIDLVTQIGSPKSIARCLQRVGRSGHSLDKISKGNLIATNRDDLIENAVISLEISKGNLDKVYIPKLSLDVLSQHVVGMAIEQQWNIKDAYELIKIHEKTHTPTAVGYCLRYMPSAIKMKELLDQKKIGNIYNAFVDIGQYLPDWRPSIKYRDSVSSKLILGGGALLELSHEIDYLQWLFGSLEVHYAQLRSSSELNLEVEELVDLVLISEIGTVCNVHLDFLQKKASRQHFFQ